MTDDAPPDQETDVTDTRDNGANETLARDLILDLNFVPAWARKPPQPVRAPAWKADDGGGGGGGRRYTRQRGPRDHDDRQATSGRRDSRRPPRGGDRRQPHRRETGAQNGPPPGHHPPYPDDARPQRPRAPFVERPPVHARLIPDQRRLSAVVRKIHGSHRAYPLVELAGLFIAGKDACCIKLEAERGQTVSFYQCKLCRSVYLRPDAAESHLLSRHMEDWFVEETVETEPPAGDFVCVARCTLSGTLLGPPNHHSYNTRVKELHDARFPAMPMDVYRRKIEVVHDASLVEQWKEASRRRTCYRLKTAAEEPAALSWTAAQDYARQHLAPAHVARVRTASVPAGVAAALDDPGLSLVVRGVLRRESQFPRTLFLALRAAFHHKGLHIFKAGGHDFVTAVKPAPLDPAHTIDTIADVLQRLREHPGCKRMDLLQALRPDAPPDSAAAQDVLRPLAWLVDRGHIIEFYDGSLSVPAGRGSRVAPPAAGDSPPDDTPPPAGADAEPTG